ncbi:MAG: leucine-rich repeat protein, partial [Prevotella sp.]|nr:leucine-rich repeat protein [Prevotella sp.]MBR2230604.1 leucine-rich repeat protein [Prevotella sp.]
MKRSFLTFCTTLLLLAMAMPVLAENISFADTNVKAICVENWDTDGDGELSMSEAAAVTILGEVFRDNEDIKSFDELQYFIGLTSISSYAFSGCRGLISICIPNTVTVIEERAFLNCARLPSITIPNSVTTIADRAFGNCGSLTTLTIPSSVKSIGNYTFHYCIGLTSITIPRTLTSMGGNPFIYCFNLKSITVESGNANYDSRENCNAVIRKSDNKLLFGCMNTIIPSSVTSIGMEAFYYCKNMKSIVIPSNVASIGSYAFMGCSGLSSIAIPSNVTAIDSYAFYECNNLTTVIMEKTTPVSITSSVFTNRKNATLFVPEGSKEGYESVEYWDDFKIISENKDITFADTNTKTLCVANWDTNGDGELSMAEAATVKGLGTAFSGNTTITSFDELKYFTGLTALGVSTRSSLHDVPFWSHTGGWGLDAPKINLGTPAWVIGESTSQPYGDIEVKAFADLSEYDQLVITYSAGSPRVLLNRDVDDGQWNEDESLSHLIDNTKGGWSAKYFTTSGNTLTVDLRQIVADKGYAHLHAIKEGGWQENVTVESMVLVKDIGEITAGSVQGFYGCTALTSVTIPASVMVMGDYAFSGCNSLTSVTVNWATPMEITQQCFINRANATLNVPAGSEAAYAAADYWKEFKNMADLNAQLPPEIIATTPAQGSFNIDPAIKQFTVKFDKVANAAKIEATLDGKALTVAPAEGFAQEITLNYTGDNLANGLHTIHITKVYPEDESLGEEVFTDSTYTFSVGVPDASDVPIELIPISYFNTCTSGSVPEGFLLYADGLEERVPSGSYSGGSRMFSDFADGGDFTSALYMRSNYLTYGLNDDDHRLTMEAGKTYTLSFNTARWKSSGQYLKVQILNLDGDPQFEQTVSCNPNVNGSKAAVTGSSAYSFGFTPVADGDYELRFVVANNAEGEDAGDSWHELLLANVKFGYIPSSNGVAELMAVNEALGTAQRIQRTYASERYNGTAQTALNDAIDQVLAEKDGFTSPSECNAAVELLANTSEALIEHANACNEYDRLIKIGADIVRQNAANKFNTLQLYAQLKSAVEKYHGISEVVNEGTEEEPNWQTLYTYDVLKNNTELNTALTELTDIVETTQNLFTITAENAEISQEGTTGVAALVERLRLGAKVLKDLDPENKVIDTALNAIDDDDDIAEMLKDNIKAALRNKMKEGADALFGNDPDTGEPRSYDMTVFIKNPNMYSPAFSTAVPGWEALAGSPKGWSNWDPTKNHSASTPYAEDGSIYLEWHQHCTVEQTIQDLPAGIYNVYFNANDNSTQTEGSTYVYAKTSDTPKIEEGIEPDKDVHYAGYAEISSSDWDYHINNIVVKDGVLTLGITSGTVSQPFLDYVKLSLVSLIDDDVPLTDAIYIDDLNARVGATTTLDINLKNSEDATAYVFDLVLPEGITVAQNENGKYIDVLSDRHAGHSRTFNYRGNNTYSLS